MPKNKTPNEADNDNPPKSPRDPQTDMALRSALSAIEELLGCIGKGKLTFDAEQEAEIAERKIKELLGRK